MTPSATRRGARNMITNYNAVQKVFKARLDDAKSYATLGAVASAEVSAPYINSAELPLTQLLGRQQEAYIKCMGAQWAAVGDLTHSNNYSLPHTALYDFPLLIAQQSDASRHI